jgi:TatD DNase family protein
LSLQSESIVAENPYIDIHTHAAVTRPGVMAVVSFRIGREGELPQTPFSAGIHPWDAAEATDDWFSFFAETRPGMVAVGEIGLDFSIENADRERQTAIFERQLQTAEEHGLPVVIHCVKAYDELIAGLRKRRMKAAVIHGFTGSPELARQLVRDGLFVSFGEQSFRSVRTVEALRKIPLENVFLESDESALSIEEIYEKAAAVLGLDVSALQDTMMGNYEKLR